MKRRSLRKDIEMLERQRTDIEDALKRLESNDFADPELVSLAKATLENLKRMVTIMSLAKDRPRPSS